MVTESSASTSDARAADGRTVLGRRAALGLGAAAAGTAVTAAMAPPAVAGHNPPRSTPDRPPASADLVTYEETRLAFRCHGFHLELLDRPVTPLGSHFQLIHFDIPTLSADGYTVELGGTVERPVKLGLDELRRRPQVTQRSIMECAGTGRSYAHPRAIYVPWFNEDIGVFEYTGTPLGPVLRDAGLLDGSTEVVFTGHDAGYDLGVHHHFERALPLDEAMADEVILAWEANGQPLLPAHGFPLRLVVPTWYGMASVKWLKAITVIDHPFQGVQQAQVYRRSFSANDGGRPIQKKLVRSSIKPPGDPDLISRERFVPQGSHLLRGMAWSGSAPVVRVQVSTDGMRTWRDAELGASGYPTTWTPFELPWEAGTPGATELASRAYDEAGNFQPLRPFWNTSGMAQNAVERIAVHVVPA
jgi:DMSO/TMAO reductase YedYZ molybdopterin-dependent catalytic subunit